MTTQLPCEKVLAKLGPFVDDELPAAERSVFEQHLKQCTSCLTASSTLQALGQGLRKAGRHEVPAALSGKVRDGLAATAASPDAPATKPRRGLFGGRLRIAFAAGLLLLAPAAVVLLWTLSRDPSRQDLLAREVVASHVRSLMVDHLTDVESSDRHELKPWFSGKLDFSPRVRSLDAHGFPLEGARLDYLQRRPVAALVYRHRAHAINLYVWPSQGAAKTNLESLTHHGYRLFHWIDDGLVHWAVSDLGAAQLRSFVVLVRKGESPSPTPSKQPSPKF